MLDTRLILDSHLKVKSVKSKSQLNKIQRNMKRNIKISAKYFLLTVVDIRYIFNCCEAY